VREVGERGERGAREGRESGERGEREEVRSDMKFRSCNMEQYMKLVGSETPKLESDQSTTMDLPKQLAYRRDEGRRSSMFLTGNCS